MGAEATSLIVLRTATTVSCSKVTMLTFRQAGLTKRLNACLALITNVECFPFVECEREFHFALAVPVTIQVKSQI